MNTINCIRSRRSIRKFKLKKIPENLLLSIIDAGRWAPSASNLNPIKYIIIEDKEIKKKIATATYNPNAVKSASVVIAVCSSTTIMQRNFRKKEAELYSIQGTAAATQNIMLAAREFGVGSCWIAILIDNKIRRILEIPDNFAIYNLIALGYQHQPPRVPAKPDINAVTYFDTWGFKAKDYVKRIKDKSLPLLENPKVKRIRKNISKTKDSLNKIISKKQKR